MTRTPMTRTILFACAASLLGAQSLPFPGPGNVVVSSGHHTYTAATCGALDVQSAIGMATDGDTVIVPAGNCTWGGPGPVVTITNQGITLQGKTTCDGSPGVKTTSCTDNTNITLSPSGGFPVSALMVTASAAHFTQITGFTFMAGAATSSGAILTTGVEADVAIRYSYNHFKNSLSNTVMMEVQGVYGLIDHALWDQTDSSNSSDPFLHVDGASNPGSNDGSAAWNRPLTLGSNKALYVEDSTFNLANGAESIEDLYTGARIVWRYNQHTFTGTNGGAAPFGGHGTDSGTLRSMFSAEVYGNTYTNNGTYGMKAAQQRGGTAVYYSNTFNGSGGPWGNIEPELYRLSCLEPANSSFWGTLTGASWQLTSSDPSTNAGRTNSTFAADFQTSHSYAAGAVIVPLANNPGTSAGHYNFQNAANCASGPYPASWNQTIAGTTTDSGGCVWTNIGGGSGGSPVRWCAANADTKCAADATCSALSSGDTCSRYFDASSANGYPGRDEPGITHNQVVSPIYAWNNGSIGISPDACTAGFLTSGTDYINGTAMPGYAPYAYPDPLQGAASGIGPGCTTAYHIDWDCDNYGVGTDPNDPAPLLGPDADDNDATVQTAAQGIAKYGSIGAFINHLEGFTPNNIWYLSTAGNDSTCAANNAALPCATWSGAWGKHSPGDAILIRAGTFRQNANYSIGGAATTSAHPDMLMAYPGELAVLDHAADGWYGISADLGAVNYTIIDGLKVQNTPASSPTHTVDGIGMDLNNAGPIQGDVIRNCEVRDYYRGIWIIAGQNGTLIERNSVHDDYGVGGGEHNIYLGSNTSTGNSSGVTVQNNLLYNAAWDNFHYNGVCSGCLLSGNIMFSANLTAGGGSANVAFQQGWTASTMQNNIVFNSSAYAVDLYDYDDGQAPVILPYNQNHNVFRNNTIVHTGQDWLGQNLSGFTPFAVLNDSQCPNLTPSSDCSSASYLDLGHNTYDNNILVEMAGTVASNAAVMRYGYFSSNDLNWLSTDTWRNNVLYAPNSAPPLSIGVGHTPATQDWAYFGANAAAFTNNLQSNPLSVAANNSWYNAPQKWNLRVQSGSPAIKAGLAADAPATDITGSSRGATPDIGAYQHP